MRVFVLLFTFFIQFVFLFFFFQFFVFLFVCVVFCLFFSFTQIFCFFFFRYFLFFSLFAFGTSSKFVPNIVSFFDKYLILFIFFFFIQTRKYNFVIIAGTTSQLLSFKIKSFTESLISIFFAHFRIDFFLFSGQNSLSHLLLFDFDEFLSFGLTYVKKFKSVSDNLFLDFII